MVSAAQLSNLVKIPSKAHCTGGYPNKSNIIMHTYCKSRQIYWRLSFYAFLRFLYGSSENGTVNGSFL